MVVGERDEVEAVLAAAGKAKVPAAVIGRTGGRTLALGGAGSLALDDLRAAHEAWLPGYMAAP